MRITVVVPALNEEKHIGNILRSLLSQSLLPHEILVVDNGSEDDTKKIAGSFPGVKVIEEPKRGLHHARQRGLEEASGDVVIATDADCIAPEHWVENLVRPLADPHVVETYGPIAFYDGHPFDRWASEVIYPLFLRITHALGQPNPPGGNHAVRKSAALAVGGYDTPFAEDIHLARKLKRVGKIVYVPQAKNYTSSRRISEEGRWNTYLLHTKNVVRRLLKLPEDYGNYYRSRTKVRPK